ncbi:MAG: hypothetical protein ABSA91_03400 [Acidimicrobiales bacterium]
MSQRFLSLRPVLLAFVLTGLMSSGAGQAHVSQAQTSQGFTAGRAATTAARGPEVTPSGQSSSGYWLEGSDGGIFAFGDAGFHGSTAGVTLQAPIVGMAATPDGKGYWLVQSDGGIFAFGDAHFDGSTGGVAIAHPMVGMAATPDGKGYWLVQSDGGIFAFGDAHFDGSTGGVAIAHPIVGMAATPDGKGYWLVQSDGGIFAFGDAHFDGSTGGVTLPAPIVGMAATPDGQGYWLVASNGGVYAFGDAHFEGSTGGVALPGPIVGIAAADLHNGPVSPNDIDGNHRLANISCPTNGWCMAVDSSGDAINYSGGAWHTPVLVDPGTTEHADLGLGELNAVSCPTTTFCMAVSDLDGYSIYNGARWSNIQWPPLGIGDSLLAVSCGSPTFCDAEVDNFGDQAQWDNGIWYETTADRSLKVKIGQGPSNVSCAPSSSAKYCVYVDNYNNYAVYDNGSWTVRGSTLFTAGYVQGEVSCYAVARCVAMDDNGYAITYNGSSWSAGSLVDPIGAPAGAPVDLSCVPGFCAAGTFAGSVIYDRVASWSAPLVVDHAHITAVSCASGTFCVTVDSSGHAKVLNPATA